jgi:hypothetical protein
MNWMTSAKNRVKKRKRDSMSEPMIKRDPNSSNLNGIMATRRYIPSSKQPESSNRFDVSSFVHLDETPAPSKHSSSINRSIARKPVHEKAKRDENMSYDRKE